MLRTVLAVLVVFFVGAIGYFIGRSSTRTELAAVASGRAQREFHADQTRSRTDPTLPNPPAVAVETNLAGPTLPWSAGGQVSGDAAPLGDRALGLPIVGLQPSSIQDTFEESRGEGGRRHEATDILAPRGTPIVAVDTGPIVKLFTSKAGGLTIYQFDPQQNYAYYYAHLDRYADGLKDGLLVKKGDVIGYVGSTGNADPKTPHLHFAIFQLGPEKHWWEGKPINPYPFLIRAVGR
jgi:murein DD-endopeptidase MepM/ murein hydrolase activator NlpD